MEVKHKNLKEDFKLLTSLGKNYGGEQFALTFTSGKYGVKTYTCSYDGTTYTNCEMADDTHVLCKFDNHGLPCGLLMCDCKICLPDTSMADGDFALDSKALAEFLINNTSYHLELTNGKSDIIETVEATFELLGTVLKGDKGDQGETGATGKDGLTTAVKVNGETYTQVDGVVDLGDIGGGSGTSDYEKLKNKPQIGGVELVGDKTLSEIGVAAENHTHTKSEITDFAHTHVKAEITDFAHTHVKAEIMDFPENVVQDASYVHTDNNYTSEDKAQVGKVSQIQQNVAYLGEAGSEAPDVPDIEAELKGLVGTSATEVADGKVLGGMRYTITLTEADDSLEISSIETSNYETIIYLSIGESVEEPVVLPDSYKSVGTPSFESGKDYVISILNGILVSGEITETEV